MASPGGRTNPTNPIRIKIIVDIPPYFQLIRSMDILYSAKAAKQLKNIAHGDKKSAQMIVNGIEDYAENTGKRHDVKVLKGRYGTFKRLRVGNYRIIFDDKNRVMLIYEIKQRQGAYND